MKLGARMALGKLVLGLLVGVALIGCKSTGQGMGESTAGNTKATLSWTAPPSDGGSPITSYSVTPYIGSTAQTPSTVPGSSTSATNRSASSAGFQSINSSLLAVLKIACRSARSRPTVAAP